MTALSGELNNGIHKLQIRVYYEDTDFSGIVYHANYLKYCERGRSEMLKLAGVHHKALDEQGVNFVVRHMVCDFKSAASIDDIVVVETRVKQVSGARFVLTQAVKLDDKELFTADVTVAIVDKAGKPQRIPPDIMNSIT